MADTLLTLNRITFSYSGKKPLFNNLSFTFKKGHFYLITGPSGSGKSSLLRLLNHLESPESGDIRFDNRPLTDYYPPDLRNRILYVQQSPAIITGTVKENLLVPFSFKANAQKNIPEDHILQSSMDRFLMNDVHLDDHVETLSVGQLQRICLIRGILLEPEVLLLDEPTSALDPNSRGIVEESAEKHVKDQGKTAIMISHQSFVPKHVSPIVLEIKNGEIHEVTS